MSNILSSLSDNHLLNLIDLKTDCTDLELELGKRLEIYAGGESAEEVESRLEKSYESIEEQSEFRRQLISDIQDTVNQLLPRYTETKDLVKRILNLIDESYVEL